MRLLPRIVALVWAAGLGLLGGPPPTLAQAGPAPITNANLSVGLNGISDWSTEAPFLDVMKTARPWIGHLPGQWGGWGNDDLAAAGYLDPQGWPLSVPRALSGISTLILTDLPAGDIAQAGRYRLSYDGSGRLEIGGRAANVRQRTGGASFDFTPGEGGVILTITATGGPKGHLRNLRVVKEDQGARLDAGEVFNPAWLSVISGVRGLRLMDWMATNDSTLSDWAARPRPDDYTYALNGVPVEVMIRLANTLGADPWFTLPHLATDDYIRHFAKAVHDGLNPGLRAYAEFSNEVWNWQFAQARWADAGARARWGRDNAWVQFYSVRAAKMADIWAEVYGPDAPSRLVRVVGVQTGWQGLEGDILQAPLWLAEAPGRTPPAAHFDAYAVTGYFSAGLGTEAKAALLHGWLAQSRDAAAVAADAAGLSGPAREGFIATHRFDLATERAARELQDGSLSGDREDSLEHLLTEVLPYHAGVARAHGLGLVMYEGGSHVVGSGPMVEDAELAAFFQHLNYSAEMGTLYQHLLTCWRDLTDAPFNAFVDVAAPSKWGSWGALRHLGDDNPRWSALARFP